MIKNSDKFILINNFVTLENRNKLDKMTVTTLGEIVEPSNKIFSQKVMEDKKLYNKKKLLTNEIIKSNKRHLDSEIVAQKRIFSVASGWNKLQNLEKGDDIIILIL